MSHLQNFEETIDQLLKSMSLREKIGQLNQIPEPQSEEAEAELKEKIRRGEVGSVILANSATAGNDEQKSVSVALYNELQRIAVEESPNHIPVIYGRDVIHGHRTVYPLPLASAAAFDPELVEKCYRNIAREASNDSIHWTFSPMLDMSRDARWGRMVEGPGEDPLVGAAFAKAAVRGFQGDDFSGKEKLVACAKHYIGYGASEGGRDYHRSEISDYSLYNYYLPAFRSAVDAGIGTIMSSFNDINGQPVTSSRYYLNDILRDDLGFDGFVVSDWASVEQLTIQGTAETREDAAMLSINAGVDMDMSDLCYMDYLETLVEKGLVSIDTLDMAVRRVLRVKFAKGLFERPYCEHVKIDRTAHLQDARELAGESMVLLKNEGVLPLARNQKVAILGPLAYERRALLGTWTLDGRANETMNFCEAMQEAIGSENVIQSYDPSGLCDHSIWTAHKADVVVLALGESHMMSGEAASLTDISLDKAQISLIHKMRSTGKKVVGVFFCGRPMAMQNVAEHLDAVLYAWHGGSETTRAACDILFGDRVPSGKTPVTFPRVTGQVPIYYNATSACRPVNGYYGEKVYIDCESSPYYPFGYGLSYTSFNYSDVKIDATEICLDELKAGKKLVVSVCVSNVGTFDGKETVQLYIRDKVGIYMRPMRELKGFQKVFIRQRESTEVVFEIGFQELGYYYPNGTYHVEKGAFEIYVGENCLTKNKAVVTVK